MPRLSPSNQRPRTPGRNDQDQHRVRFGNATLAACASATCSEVSPPVRVLSRPNSTVLRIIGKLNGSTGELAPHHVIGSVDRAIVVVVADNPRRGSSHNLHG